MFESSKTYSLFTAYFDEELYRYASNYYETHVFGRERPMYAIVGVTRVLEDVEISQRNHPLYCDMQRYLEQDFCKIPNAAQDVVDKCKPYLTGRIDVKLIPKEQGDFQILSISDDKATIENPNWFQKSGIGYVIQSYVGEMTFVAKAAVDGKITLLLKGMDVRTPEDNSKRIPYWIDYTRFVINGKTIIDTVTPTWHDNGYFYEMDVKAGEEVKIQVEWLPHRSDT